MIRRGFARKPPDGFKTGVGQRGSLLPRPFIPRLSPEQEPLWFAVPALLLIFVAVVVPSVSTLLLAFQGPNHEFVGLANFRDVLQDPETLNLSRFPGHSPPWGALVHNALWILIHLPASVGLGLLLALLFQDIPGNQILRVFIYLGMILPMVIGGVLIRFLFDENAGIVNGALELLGRSDLVRTWTAYPETALFALILGSVWLWVGFPLVLFSSGLTTIPRELYEAADIDGAGTWAKFRHITWPGLAPVTSVVVAMTVLWELKIFDIVYVATQGGPGNASLVLALEMYFAAFRALDYPHASALATILALLALLVGIRFVRTAKNA